jgi:pheromone alpha factor receptor
MDELGQFDLPEDFNALTQLLNYTTVAGPVETSFEEIDSYVHIIIKNAIIFGVRIGAAAIAAIILLLVSKNRKTPVFILNQICLILVIIQSSLYICYLFGSFASVGFSFTGFPELIFQHDLNIYAATNFFQLFLIIAIEVSMIFQVRTIFQGPDTKWLGRSMVSLSFFVGLSVVGLTFYNTVQSVITTFDDPTQSYASGALNAQPILFASSINLMSAMLIYKLIRAVRSRRYMGLKQFDGFHILLIMSTQTLIIPSILLIISYAVNSLSKIAFLSIATLIVTLSLPLSSMWASSANNAPTPTSSGYHFYQPSGKGSSYFSEPGTAATRVDTPSHRHGFDPDKSLYTPSTAAEEEAKRYWMGADEDLEYDSGFVARTTHKINPQ